MYLAKELACVLLSLAICSPATEMMMMHFKSEGICYNISS